MKESHRIAFVSVLYLGKTDYDPVDGFVCQILRIIEAFGDENSDKTGADSLVLLPGEFTIGIQPIQQQVKLFLSYNHHVRSVVSGGSRMIRRSRQNLSQTFTNGKRF